MSQIGHNNGPSMETGRGFRVHAWSKARADLIPNLPIEILRGRVRRAKELGLPYKTYASVRASTCLLYTSPSPRDQRGSRMPSSA